MIDKDDPRLTGFVLGELGDADMAQVAAAVEASSELQNVVAEIENATQLLGKAYQAEPVLSLEKSQRQTIELALNEAVESRSDNPSASSKPFSRAARSSGTEGRAWRALLASVAAALVLLIGGSLYWSDWYGSADVGSGVAMNENAPSEKADAMPTAAIEDKSVGDLSPDLAQAKKGNELGIDSATIVPSGDFLTESSDAEILSLRIMRQTQSPDTMPSPGAVASKQHRFADPASAKSASAAGDDPVGLGGGGLGGGGPEKNRASESIVAKKMMELNLESAPDSGPEVMMIKPNENQVWNDARPSVKLESLEENASRTVTAKTQQLLGRSELARLNLKVETRVQSLVQSIESPSLVYVPQKKLSISADEGGSANLSESLENKPIVVFEKKPTNVQFVRPVVVFAPGDADQLVDQLASRLDPNGKEILKLEQLLGIEGELLGLKSDALDEDTQAANAASTRSEDRQEGLGAGTFSAKDGEVNRLDERASRALLSEVRSQVSRRLRPITNDSKSKNGDESKMVFGGETQEGLLQEQPDSDSKGEFEDVEGAVAAQDDASEESEPTAAVAIHPMVPTSLADVDFTELIVELKAALDRRNLRIKK